MYGVLYSTCTFRVHLMLKFFCDSCVPNRTSEFAHMHTQNSFWVSSDNFGVIFLLGSICTFRWVKNCYYSWLDKIEKKNLIRDWRTTVTKIRNLTQRFQYKESILIATMIALRIEEVAKCTYIWMNVVKKSLKCKIFIIKNLVTIVVLQIDFELVLKSGPSSNGLV